MIISYKNKISMLAACFLTILTSGVWAQESHNKMFTVIDIILEDTAMAHGTVIEFNMNTDGINVNHPGYTRCCTTTLNSKVTRMIIPLSTTLNYGRIEYDDDILIDGNLQKRPLDFSNNLFLFQNGDTVTLHLSEHKKGAFFTGKCADRYNCMYRIGSDGYPGEIKSFAKVAVDMQMRNYKAALTYQKFQLDSLYKIKLNILNEYKHKLSPEAYNLIYLDSWALFNQYVVDLYLDIFTRKNDGEYEVSKALFIADYGNYKESIFKDTALLVKSYQYCEFLTAKEKSYAVIINSTDEHSYYSDTKFSDINAAIDLHYQRGILKDKVKLLSFLNIDRRRQADFVNYLREAVNESGNNQFGTALIAFKAANQIGVNAFPFELKDQYGKVRRLTDFKGKVIIIDFWFTGCHGCLYMAKTLKPIAESFKTNPNIVFVTVSIDKDKEMWRKSLAMERYSSNDEVNLLAEAAMQSTIIQYYNINSFPTLIAISKDGKIISTAPPDPRIDTGLFNSFINRCIN